MSDLDYTTAQRVKDEMGSVTTVTPEIIQTLIGAASRAIDRKATGAVDQSALNYFRLDTVTDEQIWGQIDSKGIITTAPRKPSIVSVSAFQYRADPTVAWQSVAVDRVVADGGPLVRAYTSSSSGVGVSAALPVGRIMVKLSYIGGLAATTDALPDDLQELAAILTIRYLREAQTGMSDMIGVAELVGSNLFYTKAWPQRALDLLMPFKRVVSWRGIS